MKRTVILALCILLLFSACKKQEIKQSGAPVTDAVKAGGLAFVQLLIAGDYKAAFETFDDKMKSVMDEAKLKSTFEQLEASYGKATGCVVYSASKSGEYDSVEVKTDFEKATLILRVVFAGDGKVSGFWLLPYTGQAAAQPPENIIEEEFPVKTGNYSLNGKLALPEDAKAEAAVILVHGSGPSDMNETVGANAPFRDIAWGLASRKTAVLRYDKRTYAYAAELSEVQDITVYEETVEDVVSAYNQLKTRFDGPIYILGHSMGAMLMPMIAEHVPDAAGYIMLAGNARPLQQLMVEQYEYLFSIQEVENAQAQLEEIKRQAELAMSVNSENVDTIGTVLGVPASYWLALNEYDMLSQVKDIYKPLLILQGERDYQVTMTDYELWKAQTSDMANVICKSYPALNHILVAGEGKSTPSEYYIAGSVDEQVLNDISEWIKGN